MYVKLLANIRHYLGALQRIETQVAKIAAAQRAQEATVSDLSREFDSVTALLQDISSDVKALKEGLEPKLNELDADTRAALDRLVASARKLDEEVGDADGSDTPAPEEPTEPGPAARR